MKKGLLYTHRFLPAMVVHKDGMADHDVAEASDGDRDEAVPQCEQVEDGDVDQAGDGRVEHAPGGLSRDVDNFLSEKIKTWRNKVFRLVRTLTTQSQTIRMWILVLSLLRMVTPAHRLTMVVTRTRDTFAKR